MKAASFAYHRPDTVADAVGLLAELGDARVLAGGQSLVPMLNLRLAAPAHLIDINRVDGLSDVTRGPDGVRIGALTRQRALMADPTILADVPVLADALRFVGHVQTRSRGTIGGSLCHLDPSAEQVCIAALYGARLHVESRRGMRDVAIADWASTFMTPTLEPDELLTALTLPVWPEPHGYGFVEFSRRHGDYAIVLAAALLALDPAGKIVRVAVALSGIDYRPVRLHAMEEALVGELPTSTVLREAAEAARQCEAMEDLNGSTSYRQHLAAVLTSRALCRAAERAAGASS